MSVDICNLITKDAACSEPNMVMKTLEFARLLFNPLNRKSAKETLKRDNFPPSPTRDKESKANDPLARRRHDLLRRWLPIEHLDGLEIGPLDKPLVERPRFRVWYLDVMSEDSLHKISSVNPNRDETKLVKLDYVTGQNKVSQVVDRKFDYMVACHVLEHIPNFFGWLRELSYIMRPHASIFAVVPDKRFTFDHLRPKTSLGEFIENDRKNLQKPSFRSAFDQAYYLTDKRPTEHWSALCDGEQLDMKRIRTPEFAYRVGVSAESAYIDRHCSVFDPESFRETIECSYSLGLQPFKCIKLRPTARPQGEFSVLLKLCN